MGCAIFDPWMVTEDIPSLVGRILITCGLAVKYETRHKHIMPRWAAGTTDFVVAVVPNVRAGTRYSNIPPPVLEKMGNPKRIRFSIRGDAIMAKSVDK